MSRLLLGLVLVSLSGLAEAQSLAEAARKERERREEIEKAGESARVVGGADLAASQGRVANDATAESDGAEPEDAAREVAPPPVAPAGASASEVRAQQEAYWRGRAAEARGRLERAQERQRQLDRMIRLGQPAAYDENGKRVMYSLAALKRMADEADAEVKAAQEALDRFLREARLAGALPGWLR